MSVDIKQELLKHKVLFIKTSNIPLSIEWALKEVRTKFNIVMESDKNDLIKSFQHKIESDKTIFPPVCFITTNMLNSFTDTEIILLYIFQSTNKDIFWIDIGNDCKENIKKVVNVIDFNNIEQWLVEILLKSKNYSHQIINYLKNCPLTDILSILQEITPDISVNELAFVKAKMLHKKHGLFLISETVLSQKVGGCYQYKNWIKSIKYIRENKSDFLHFIPKGIIFYGWTGVGKSYLSKMTATYLNLPLFKFDMSFLLSKFIGESEKRVKEFLANIKIFEPCVLWLDELDKLFVNWQNENTGVIARLLSEILFFMQEEISDVLFVGTVNHHELVPHELMRKGRFSEFWYVPPPSYDARKEIFKIYLDSNFCDEIDYNILAEQSEGFTCSEICTIIKDLIVQSIYGNNKLNTNKIVSYMKKMDKSIQIQKEKFLSLTNFVSSNNIKSV